MNWNDEVLIFTKIFKDIKLYLAGDAATDIFIVFLSCCKVAAVSSKPIVHYNRTVLQLIQFPVEGAGNEITWTECGLVSYGKMTF